MHSDSPVLAFGPWRKTIRLLEGGRSVIAYAPKQYGQHLVRKHLIDNCRPPRPSDGETDSLLPGKTPVHLHLPQFLNGAVIDARALWRSTSRQLGDRLPQRKKPKTPGAYMECLEDVLLERPGRVLLILTGSGRGYEPAFFELMAGYYSVLLNLPSNKKDDFTILLFDDYSLYYYENWITESVSDWDYFDSVSFNAATVSEIHDFINASSRDRQGAEHEELDAATAHSIHRLTGGHAGLVLELASDLMSREWRVAPEYRESDARALLEGTSTMIMLQEALRANPDVFAKEALAFEEPRFPERPEFPNLNIQYLRQIGVLQGQSHGKLGLCGGVVRDLVHTLAASKGVPSRAASQATGDAAPQIAADDFVIVHISDLHVGSFYRFHLSTLSGLDYHGRKTAAEVLHEDLQRLGFVGRIDALIVSGDFAEAGHDTSLFIRASEVLEEIRASLGLRWDQVVIVAGNHDMNWNPSAHTVVDPETRVSRENFETIFGGLTGTGKLEHATLHSIRSRGGRRRLRIIGLDSNLVEGPDATGIGYVGHHTIRRTEELLSANAEKEGGAEQVLTWIVVHHHLFPATSPKASDAHQRKVSIIGNASDLLLHAASWRVEMILHGHEHQPSVTVAQRWKYPPREGAEFSRLVTAGAGSLALNSHLGPIRKNHYFVHCRRARDLVIHSRIMDANDMAFTAHDTIRIDLE